MLTQSICVGPEVVNTGFGRPGEGVGFWCFNEDDSSDSTEREHFFPDLF